MFLCVSAMAQSEAAWSALCLAPPANFFSELELCLVLTADGQVCYQSTIGSFTKFQRLLASIHIDKVIMGALLVLFLEGVNSGCHYLFPFYLGTMYR